VKILAFEPTTNRKFFSDTIDALIFKSDDNGILAAWLSPNNVSDFKIGVHWMFLIRKIWRGPPGPVRRFLAESGNVGPMEASTK
jgi:hypothetical protein